MSVGVKGASGTLARRREISGAFLARTIDEPSSTKVWKQGAAGELARRLASACI
jgi:hypothetical protein